MRGRNWDNCSNIINKIYFKKSLFPFLMYERFSVGNTDHQTRDLTLLSCIFLHLPDRYMSCTYYVPSMKLYTGYTSGGQYRYCPHPQSKESRERIRH